MNVIIIELNEEQRKQATQLIWETFLEFEAPDYPKEGIDMFWQCINNDWFMSTLRFYGAYHNGQIKGVIATKSQGNHIALFFVDKKYHRMGIGRKLFQQVVEHSTSLRITVKSSPYAQEVYHRLGFTLLGDERIEDGIRFIPMIYKKKK